MNVNTGDLIAILGLLMLGVGIGGLVSVYAGVAVVGLVVMIVGGLLSLAGGRS